MPYRMAVVGASLSGLDALKVLLGGLPAELPMAVVVAQHRGMIRVGDLPTLLGRYCALRVVEPEDKDPISPGTVYLAPAGYHLLVEPGRFARSVGPPKLCARRSIDVLFVRRGGSGPSSPEARCLDSLAGLGSAAWSV